MYTQEVETVRSNVRRYFFGPSKTLPMALIVIGFFTMFIMIGFVLIAVGVTVLIINAFTGNYNGQEEADQAVRVETNRLYQRGIEKLNLITEDVGLIEPICLQGFGVEPDANLGTTENDVMPKKGLRGFFSNLKKTATLDPVDLYKIGSDDVLRSMLISVTLFMFTENQMMVYSGNVDISTSKIYNEKTSEIFYKDITSIDTLEVLSKQFNPKKKNFTYFTRESIVLSGNGIGNVYSFRAMGDNSYINNQFTAMKNLIREKKG